MLANPFREVSHERRVIWRFAFPLDHRRVCIDFSIYAFWINGQNNFALWNNSVKHQLIFFHRLFDPLPSGFRSQEQSMIYIPSTNRQVHLAMLRCSSSALFMLFVSVLRVCVHAYTTTSNT